MKRVKHFLEYCAVRLMDGLFFMLPRKIALFMGETLGILFSFVIRKRHRLIQSNLRHAFPKKSEKEIQSIAHQVWKNLGRTAVEFIRLPKTNKSNYRDIFQYKNLHHLDEAEKMGKGVIVATFHFTNWEMAGISTQFERGNLVAIARPMKNPFVEKWVQGKRKNCGMDIILHRQAVRASLKTLKQKKILGILVDQNLYQGGVFVDFFGRPAASTTLPSLLHIRTGAPIVVGYVNRVKNKFELVFEPPLKFPEIKDSEEKLAAYTQIISKQIEAIIRKKPENWFWIHNRWKRSPT